MEGAGGTGGPGCGARGRRRDQAGQRADAPSHTPAHPAPLVWRAPEEPEGTGGLRGDASNHTSAHRAPLVWRAPEGPEGTGGLRGAAPNAVRTPSLADGQARRRPEHPWRHKQHHQLGGPPPTGTQSSPASCNARNTRGTISSPAHRHPQRHEAATGFPATAS